MCYKSFDHLSTGFQLEGLRTKKHLCSIALFLVLALLPGALGTGFILHVYGNANMDGTIDQADITFIRSMLEGKENETQLADANFDGRVNEEDIAQVEMLIAGKERNITLMDGNGRPLTIKKPVERMVVEYLDNADMAQILNKTDKVVGVDLAVANSEAEFPEISKRTNVGAMHKEPDYEKVLSLQPDLLLVFSNVTAEKEKNLPGIPVLFAGLYYPDLLNPETSGFTDAVRKLGYVLDAREEAEDYIQWHIGSLNEIKAATQRVPENERPSVLVAAYPDADAMTIFTFAKIDTLTNMVELAGGRTVAAELPDFMKSTYRIEVDPEWVLQEDPDYIVLLVVATTYSGLELEPPSGYDADDPAGMAEALEAFKSRPEYANLTAVRNDQVYILSGNMRNDATKGLIGAAYLTEIFNPEQMELGPEELHRNYLEKFLGLNYDLDQHGVFIYPPLVKEDGRVEGVPDRYYQDGTVNAA